MGLSAIGRCDEEAGAGDWQRFPIGENGDPDGQVSVVEGRADAHVTIGIQMGPHPYVMLIH